MRGFWSNVTCAPSVTWWATLQVGLALLTLALWLRPTHAYAKHEACLRAHEQAQASRHAGHYVEARRELIECGQNSCPALVRADCMAWLSEVESSIPSLVFAVTGENGQDLIDARVLLADEPWIEHLDGRAVELDPGVYQLTFVAAGHRSEHRHVTVREGEKGRLVAVRLAPEATPDGSGEASAAPAAARTETLPLRLKRSALALGITAVALGGSALIGIHGRNLQDEVRKAANAANDPDAYDRALDNPKWDRGKRLIVAAWVLGAAAGASAVTALGLYLASRRARPALRNALRTPSFGGDARGFSLIIRGTF